MAVTALPRSSFWLAAARCSTRPGMSPAGTAALRQAAARRLHTASFTSGVHPLRGAAIPAGGIQGAWRAQRIRTCIWRRCRCVKHIDLANPKWVGEAWNKAADRFVIIHTRSYCIFEKTTYIELDRFFQSATDCAGHLLLDDHDNALSLLRSTRMKYFQAGRALRKEVGLDDLPGESTETPAAVAPSPATDKQAGR